MAGSDRRSPGLAYRLIPSASALPPCTLCPIELDALSYGFARPLQPQEPPGTIWFSVDEYSAGIPGSPAQPNVWSEGVWNGVAEAAGDAFIDIGLPVGPIPPPIAGGPVVGNVGSVDGDGLVSASGFAYPGLGLIEAAPPTFIPCDQGDNLDALTLVPGAPGPMVPAWFSLDASFGDPFGYPNETSALANGFVGGDVLFTFAPGGPPILWAPAPVLGLDLAGPPDSDDLDALMLWENGSGVYEPSLTPYDWLSGNTDMLLFSVRRGSRVIGLPDSVFGVPISEGDILTTPLAGGMSPFPGILIAAEALGLGTVRSGFANPLHPFDDELNALSSAMAPILDCNANGVEDALDIAFGTSSDINANGVPDDCELISTSYCFGVGCPCGNNDASAGCANGTGVGALMTGSGTTSVLNDDLVLTTVLLPTNQFGIFYMGSNQINLPFGNGLRCAGGFTFRYNPPTNSGAGGTISLGPGIVQYSCLHFGCIVPFTTWNFQTWYRDPGGPCGFSFNTSNAMSVTFTP